MWQLSGRARKWFSVFHSLVSKIWLGAAVAIFVVPMNAGASGGTDTFSLLCTITTVVMIPAAVVSMVTGVFMSLFSHWGLFRHWWIVAKLVFTAGVFVFISALLLPWIREAMAETSGTVAPTAAFVSGIVLSVLLLALMILSAISVRKTGASCPEQVQFKK